jgi:hypothetical protein
MNTQHENNDNLLKEYFNSSKIEKAPAGFTGKVMTMVNLEAKQVKIRKKLRSGYLVPAISVIVTLILTITVLLLPVNSYDFSGMPLMKMFRDITLPAVHVNLDTLFNFAVPAYLPYLFICILFLVLFDRGLSSLFHRSR